MNNLRTNNRSAVSFIQSMVAEKSEKKTNILTQPSHFKIAYILTDYEGSNGRVDCSAPILAAHEDSHMDHYVPPTWADYQNESGGRHGDEHIDREY